MNDYYVIKNENAEAFITTIYRNSLSTSGEYYNAIPLSTQAMAEQFLAYCQSTDSGIEFAIYHVEVTLTEVTVTQA